MTNNTPPTDAELTARITSDLLSLPDEMRQSDSLLAQAKQELAQARRDLESAELDATVNAVLDGKNAEQRKLQAEAALRDDPACKDYKAKVFELESAVSAMEVDNKGLSRRWVAALALAELQAAKINYLSHTIRAERATIPRQ